VARRLPLGDARATFLMRSTEPTEYAEFLDD